MATEGKEAEIAALASSRGRVSMEVKAIISSLTTDANGSAGDLVVPQRGGLVGPAQRRMTIRDLLTPGRTTSSSIQYPQEIGLTNSAATHTEDRKSVVQGKSVSVRVDLVGRRLIKENIITDTHHRQENHLTNSMQQTTES